MNLSRKTVKLLWGAFLLLCALVIAQNVFIISLVPEFPSVEGQATGEVYLCINSPPYYLNNISCSTAFTLSSYTCNMTTDLIDPDNTTNWTFTGQYLTGNVNGSGLFNNFTSTGLMQFYAEVNQTGNYTVNVTVSDGGLCALSTSVIVNISIVISNQSPVLLSNIPDTNWTQDTVSVPYNLNTYFSDPEGGPLTFRASGNTQIGISISANGEVTLNPAAGVCDITEIVTYTATDNQGLETTSNSVTLMVECEEDTDTGSTTSSSSSSGGGGGGGSARVERRACIENRHCYDWSACQFTEAVTGNGENLSLVIEGPLGSRTYLLEEAPEDVDIFYNGYTWRECIDTNKCDTHVDTYVRTCDYEPSCFDHIQNQDETGIDCGGVCKPCGTCEDGIQNGGEQGVDCGGPLCAPCYTCTDGILNGNELKVDCGGADCPACPTCFDGIRNQDETGIDCGGPCAACVQQNTPGNLLGENPITSFLLTLLAIIAGLVLVVYVLRKWIRSLISKLQFKHKRKNRVVILTVDAKKRILDALASIESRLGIEPTLKLQEELSAVVRTYFKEAFALEFEFTYSELIERLQTEQVLPLLQEVLKEFFSRSAELEFSGVRVMDSTLQALIDEVREIVYQTSVLTVDDLREREQDLKLRDIPDNVPTLDKAYLLLSNGHIALRYARKLMAEHIYYALQDVYATLPPEQQRIIYNDFKRYYSELQLVDEREGGLFGGSRKNEVVDMDAEK